MFWLLYNFACTQGGGIAVDPASLSQFGYEPVTIDLSGERIDAQDVTAVRLGGIGAYDLTASGEILTVIGQGVPEPGPVTLSLTVDDEQHEFDAVYSVDEAVDPVFTDFYAVGASLTQGVQNGVPTYHGALHSPTAWIARQAGAFHPLPLLLPGLFPEIGPDDIGGAPGCEVPDVSRHVGLAAADVIVNLQDADGNFAYYPARVDADLAIRNLAVGGANARDVLHGAENFGTLFVEHLTLDPYGGLSNPVPESQLDWMERSLPSLVLSTDLFGNDIILALVDDDGIVLDRMTPEQELHDTIVEAVDRMAATGAQVFVATLPRPTILPATDEAVRKMVSDAEARAARDGEDVESAGAEARKGALALAAEVERRGLAANEVLWGAADGHDNVVVVDLYALVEEVSETGLALGDGTVLWPTKFGGLLGLDGVHFTDTGYAWLANVFMASMDQALGLALPPVDLAHVHNNDTASPAALEADGLDIGACE